MYFNSSFFHEFRFSYYIYFSLGVLFLGLISYFVYLYNSSLRSEDVYFRDNLNSSKLNFKKVILYVLLGIISSVLICNIGYLMIFNSSSGKEVTSTNLIQLTGSSNVAGESSLPILSDDQLGLHPSHAKDSNSNSTEYFSDSWSFYLFVGVAPLVLLFFSTWIYRVILDRPRFGFTEVFQDVIAIPIGTMLVDMIGVRLRSLVKRILPCLFS